jgi:hypothetical protein
VKLTVPVLRDLVMLGMGSAGMLHELFRPGSMDDARVGLSMVLILGSAMANARWFLRHTPPPGEPTGELSPTGPSPSSLPSSSPSSSP